MSQSMITFLAIVFGMDGGWRRRLPAIVTKSPAITRKKAATARPALFKRPDPPPPLAFPGGR
jgi:hypothetical protein